MSKFCVKKADRGLRSSSNGEKKSGVFIGEISKDR